MNYKVKVSQFSDQRFRGQRFKLWHLLIGFLISGVCGIVGVCPSHGSITADEVISARRVISLVRKIQITDQLKSLAEKGDLDAQYRLSLAYLFESSVHRGTEQYWNTIEKGKEMAKRAASQGHPQAMYVVAHFSENSSEKMKWLKSSAQKNYPPALHDVGLMYFYGHFEDQSHNQDYGVALDYLNRASDKGSLRSRMRVAQIYFKGLGVSPDTQKAHDLILSAAEHGLSRAYHRLALDWYDQGGLTPNRRMFQIYERMYKKMQEQYAIYCDNHRSNLNSTCSATVEFDNPLYNIFFQLESFIFFK